MINKIQKAIFKKLEKYKSSDIIKQVGRNESVVYYGKYNDLPNKYITLLDENVYHDAAVKAKAMFYQGDGLAYEDESDLPEIANRMGQSYNEINEKIAKDYSLFGGYSLIVIWTIDSISPDGNREIAEIYHQPFQDVRAEEANEFGVVDNYFVSRRWRDSDNSNISRIIDQAERIPSFNPNSLIHEDGSGNVVTEEKQILVFKGSSFSSEYYPDPDYKGGLNNIILGAELVKMKLSYTSRAIINGLHVKYIGDPGGDDEMQRLTDDFDSQMSGALNQGATMFSHAKEAGQGFTFEQISTGSESNVFQNYEADVQNAILAAHKITFKEAIGLEPEGKGLSAQEVEEKFTIFFNTVIRKGQQKILYGWNKLTPFIGSGLKFELNRVDLLEGLTGEVGDNISDEDENTNEVIPTI